MSEMEPFRLLAAARNDILHETSPARVGPFVCWGRFPQAPAKEDLEHIQARVLHLASTCLWPTTWHALPPGGEPPVERLNLISGEWVWIIDLERRGDAFRQVLVRSVVGRLPPQEVPTPDLAPDRDGLAFLSRYLSNAGLLRHEFRGQWQLHWYQGDGFHAALAAVDAAILHGGIGATPVKSPRVVVRGRGESPIVLGKPKRKLTTPQYNVIQALLDAGEAGLTKDELVSKSGHEDARGILTRLKKDDDWNEVIHFAGQTGGGYRIK